MPNIPCKAVAHTRNCVEICNDVSIKCKTVENVLVFLSYLLSKNSVIVTIPGSLILPAKNTPSITRAGTADQLHHAPERPTP